MRLTTRTNLAVRILMMCAVNEARTVRTADIARSCNASLNHLLHVVSALQALSFLETIRGRGGGLRLAVPGRLISIGAVFRLFEAGVPVAECFDPLTNTCPLAGACRLKTYIAAATEAFYCALDQVSLDDLVIGNCGLEALLSLRPRPLDACPSPVEA